jgi:hypothetical protein
MHFSLNQAILLKVALYTIKQANIMQRFHVQFIPKILSLMDKIHVTVHVHVNIDFFFCVVYFKKKPFCPLIHRELWPLNGLIK